MLARVKKHAPSFMWSLIGFKFGGVLVHDVLSFLVDFECPCCPFRLHLRLTASRMGRAKGEMRLVARVQRALFS